MKYLLPALLMVSLCLGCTHRYDMTLTNGLRVTRVSKPKLDKDTGQYTFSDIRGRKKTISASRVVEISPHKEPKAPQRQQ